jgi:hypothetical protein
MALAPLSFHNQLAGRDAFYNASNYLESTRHDFASKVVLSPSYAWNTEHKIIRIVKQVLSTLFFPVGIYHWLHSLIAKVFVLPASNSARMQRLGYAVDHVDQRRASIDLTGVWKYKRISIEVDGYEVDAMIVGKESTLENGRWVVLSNGNGEFYEDKLSDRSDFKALLEGIEGNGILFNYPGVGASVGLPSRQAMKKAYRAVLAFLEDREKGIGAKEIVGYGHSIGGAVQGDALQAHCLREEIQYVFIKSRTFSDLSTMASTITQKLIGLFVTFFGWNISSIGSSKKMKVPEIILQTADFQEYRELTDPSNIIDDGVIPATASLAKAVLEDQEWVAEKRLIIGVPERHNNRLTNVPYLSEKIRECLSA